MIVASLPDGMGCGGIDVDTVVDMDVDVDAVVHVDSGGLERSLVCIGDNHSVPS